MKINEIPLSKLVTMDEQIYDHYIVAFSGGKDSMACFLFLLDQGIPKEKIELWHHLVDGREGSTLMDWPVTEDYCRKVAEAFGVKIFFSWKTGGFETEMNRENSLTKPNKFEYPQDNLIECGISGGVHGTPSTRKKFPQVSPDLRVRWCSAYLKIDVCTASINNQLRFNNAKTVVLSGERAEESAARSKYKMFEPDRSDNRNGKSKRLVDHWRPVHQWKEKEVWNIIEKYKINPHPAYKMGWGRLSCMYCIFGNASQWKSAKTVDNARFNKIASYERRFGVTIRRDGNIIDASLKGRAYSAITPELIEEAKRIEYTEPVFVEKWETPAGAYGDSTGPT